MIYAMSSPPLGKLELRIMNALWERGASSVREILESFPEKKRPAYTTVQTMVYRLERKKAVRRAKKISNANIFEATLTRDDARERFIDELNEIGIDERERIEAARGVPLPCAVLDRSGQNMPVDMSGFGIARFDLGRDDWRGKFHVWFDQARARPAAAP